MVWIKMNSVNPADNMLLPLQSRPVTLRMQRNEGIANHLVQELAKLSALMVPRYRPALEHVKRSAVGTQRLTCVFYRQKHTRM